MYSWTGILCLSDRKKIGQAYNKKIREASPGFTKKLQASQFEFGLPAAYV